MGDVKNIQMPVQFQLEAHVLPLRRPLFIIMELMVNKIKEITILTSGKKFTINDIASVLA